MQLIHTTFTILVGCWKIFRRYFSVRGRCRDGAGVWGTWVKKSSLVVPLVIVFKVLVFVIILVFV